MKPVRSYLCSATFARHQSATLDEHRDLIRQVSLQLQSERRKLWKMQKR